MRYEVIKEHRSHYPNPITLSKGQSVLLGKKYEGPENWNNWIFCYTLDGSLEGWVPEQIIQSEEKIGLILEDYTAKELDVDVGEIVVGTKEWNGWIWCEKRNGSDSGWIPRANLRPLP